MRQAGTSGLAHRCHAFRSTQSWDIGPKRSKTNRVHGLRKISKRACWKTCPFRCGQKTKNAQRQRSVFHFRTHRFCSCLICLWSQAHAVYLPPKTTEPLSFCTQGKSRKMSSVHAGLGLMRESGMTKLVPAKSIGALTSCAICPACKTTEVR